MAVDVSSAKTLHLQNNLGNSEFKKTRLSQSI